MTPEFKFLVVVIFMIKMFTKSEEIRESRWALLAYFGWIFGCVLLLKFSSEIQ